MCSVEGGGVLWDAGGGTQQAVLGWNAAREAAMGWNAAREVAAGWTVEVAVGRTVARHTVVEGGVSCGRGTGWLPRKSALGEQVGDLLRYFSQSLC